MIRTNTEKSVNEINRGYRKGESNMYVDREPRFYASVHYNGRSGSSLP